MYIHLIDNIFVMNTTYNVKITYAVAHNKLIGLINCTCNEFYTIATIDINDFVSLYCLYGHTIYIKVDNIDELFEHLIDYQLFDILKKLVDASFFKTYDFIKFIKNTNNSSLLVYKLACEWNLFRNSDKNEILIHNIKCTDNIQLVDIILCGKSFDHALINMACLNCNYSMLKYLIEKSNATHLHNCVGISFNYCYSEILNYLIETDIPFAKIAKWDFDNIIKSKYFNHNMVRTIVQHSNKMFDFEITDVDRYNAFNHCCRNGSLDCVDAWIESGLDVQNYKTDILTITTHSHIIDFINSI